MSEQMSRRKFLQGMGAATAVGLAGTLVAGCAEEAQAATLPELPWPYEELDPQAVAERAYEIYWTSHCCEGVAYSVVEALAEKIGEPWSQLPKGMWVYGAGGGGGFGTLCGALNGALGVLDLLGAHGDLTAPLMTWYSGFAFPSDLFDEFVPTDEAATAPLVGAPTSVAGSPLCHVSVTEWAVNTDQEVGTPEHSDRCGKLTGDVAYKMVEMLNAYFADGTIPEAAIPADVAACGGCHSGEAYGKLDCGTCHEPHE